MSAAEDKELIWIPQGTRELLKTRILTVNEQKCVSPKGETGDFVVIDSRDFAIVVPVLTTNPEQFVMVRQWRQGTQSLSIEFPGGVFNPGETPEQAARRELQEETGCIAGTLVPLGTLKANPAIMSNTAHIFAAFDLTDTKKRHLDNDEYVSVLIQDAQTVYRGFGSAPEYQHALMAAVLWLYGQRYSPNTP
ncbi:MAG: NUDIX hydrolase [Treponema sp.]|jgi:8-oxo-dGTP pyrophosphatase MutT (NUDIX family)|nr:NUDIX hydrolase [Treponema sp.]